MTRLQRLGPLAAFANPIIGLGMLIIALGVIGTAALSDPLVLVEMAINNPLPLILQDVLKLAAAAIAVILVLALSERLREPHPRLIGAANGFGFFSAICLVANAALSFYATSQAETFATTSPETGIQLNGAIGVLGMAVIFFNGPWYLFTGWAGMRSGRLPRGLCIVGMVMGVTSLFPPLGIIVLILSLGWSIWLGRTLMTHD